MENFLEEGGLMHLKESLEENGIDSIDLITQLVQDKSFEETVPRLGDRLKIKRKLSLSQKTCYDEVTDQISTKKIIIDVPDIHATPSEVQSLRSTSSIDLDFTSTPIVFNITPTPVLSSIIIGDNTFHLEQLLQNSLMGRAIIELYRTNGQLSTTCQSYLVELIVQHLINIQPFRRLTNEDFRRLSKHIVELFPGELHQVYFTSPIKKRNSKDNKSGVARGKLVDKYRNRLTFLRKSGIISAKYTDKEEINTPEPNERNLEDDDFEEDLVWLIHNREPWGEVINKWSQTFEYRKQLIRQDIEFQEILQKFPIIKNPLGYTLIDIDFKRTFQPQYQLIFKKFEPIFHKLLELKKKNLNHGDLLIVDLIQSEKINVESRHYYMLTLLASLLPQKSYGKKGNIWHPRITDSVKGVIVHIKIPAEIEDTINSKRKFLSKYNLPLLPFVIIQGPSISEIENVYVVYNDIIYRCDGVLKAIDICFQIIHIFNLRYPYESENIWMFIQIGMYNLNTPYDKIPNILDLVNKCS
ncbi:uncharacterized protein LOC123670948 [Harmonia axyridis]|uniref:uncharacterized protein LOC123670948 n=1 Tax=Harmonia axyridis TaxID=115357 RepID=UPI001E275D93|nr:uncharacterized protein LOC123670948 [Harmonia axyridis]